MSTEKDTLAAAESAAAATLATAEEAAADTLATAEEAAVEVVVKAAGVAEALRGERTVRVVKIALGSVLTTIFIIGSSFIAASIFDARTVQPRQRQLNSTVEEVAINGENLCDLAAAISHVVIAFSQDDQEALTPEQRAALADLDEVDDRCNR